MGVMFISNSRFGVTLYGLSDSSLLFLLLDHVVINLIIYLAIITIDPFLLEIIILGLGLV